MIRPPSATPRPAPSARWHALSTLLLTILALCSATSVAGACADGVGALEIQGRWRVYRGSLSRGGRLSLRQLDARRVSLALDLPSHPLLPARQILLREGIQLLHWAEPSTAESLLEGAPELRELLAALPPAAWTALLSGRGLVGQLEDPVLEAGRWPALRGALGGGEAILRSQGGRAQRMIWTGESGKWTLVWRDGGRGRGSQLSFYRDGSLKVRIISRLRRCAKVGEEDWLFLANPRTFREPRAG